MRRVAIVACCGVAAACSLLAGSGGHDPLAGWEGLWTGSYSSAYGQRGSLSFEFGVDSAGVPVGEARFESGNGRQRVPLGELALTEDSLRTALRFDGVVADVIGVRVEDVAEGTYTVTSGGEVVDSGDWSLTRSP